MEMDVGRRPFPCVASRRARESLAARFAGVHIMRLLRVKTASGPLFAIDVAQLRHAFLGAEA